MVIEHSFMNKSYTAKIYIYIYIYIYINIYIYIYIYKTQIYNYNYLLPRRIQEVSGYRTLYKIAWFIGKLEII